jgi:hypothetical protein
MGKRLGCCPQVKRAVPTRSAWSGSAVPAGIGFEGGGAGGFEAGERVCQAKDTHTRRLQPGEAGAMTAVSAACAGPLRSPESGRDGMSMAPQEDDPFTRLLQSGDHLPGPQLPFPR